MTFMFALLLKGWGKPNYSFIVLRNYLDMAQTTSSTHRYEIIEMSQQRPWLLSPKDPLTPSLSVEDCV